MRKCSGLRPGASLPTAGASACRRRDEQFVLGVNRVFAIGERELEEFGLGDCFSGARLDAQVTVNAAQVVDLVDPAEALAR